jgi:hypothetical protein
MLQQVEIAMNTMATIPENAQPLLSTNLPKSHKSLKLIITIFSYVVFIACIIMQFITLLSGGSGTKLPDNTGNNASSGLIACSPGYITSFTYSFTYSSMHSTWWQYNGSM